MVHQSACFFHRWAGRPTPLSCSFAASLAVQRAKSKQQRPGWRGRKLRVPAAGGGGSVSTLEAPSGAGGHGARHRSSLLSQVPAWSAPGRAQEGRFRGGAGAWSRGAGASCPRSFGPSLRLRRPTVQSPGCWRSLGCTLRGCEGGEAGGGRGGVVLPWPPVGRGGRWAPDVRIAPSISARELLGNRPTLLSALPRPLAGEEGVARIYSHCSEQRGRDIGEA